LTPPSDDEVRGAVEAINLAIEGLPQDVHVSLHVCQVYRPRLLGRRIEAYAA
jgi:methionine synthase II (cobalamin-independent)